MPDDSGVHMSSEIEIQSRIELLNSRCERVAKGFDPSQPRDKDGKWAALGARIQGLHEKVDRLLGLGLDKVAETGWGVGEPVRHAGTGNAGVITGYGKDGRVRVRWNNDAKELPGHEGEYGVISMANSYGNPEAATGGWAVHDAVMTPRQYAFSERGYLRPWHVVGNAASVMARAALHP